MHWVKLSIGYVNLNQISFKSSEAYPGGKYHILGLSLPGFPGGEDPVHLNEEDSLLIDEHLDALCKSSAALVYAVKSGSIFI